MITETKSYRVKSDDTGVIEYAQCRITGRFVKHSLAYAELQSDLITTILALGMCILSWLGGAAYLAWGAL